MADRVNVADVRDLLAAIRETLTLPRHASHEHADARNQLLVNRAAMLCGILTSVAKHLGEDDCRNQARSVRELIAEDWPVTYPIRQDAQTEGVPARGTGECPDPECWGCPYCEGPTDAERAEADRPVPVDLADEPADRAPAHDLPQLAIACPMCEAPAGELCTSHGGTRVRPHNTHLARTNRWANSKGGDQ